MSRLRHSQQGFVRYMQISGKPLFVFAEGKRNDRYVYGRLSRMACAETAIDYEVITSSELTGNSGGKELLLNFYEFLFMSDALFSEFKGKKTGIIFFMDKDTDDILRQLVKSKHVIYTKYYDIENHIFRNSNFTRAASALAGLDERDLSDLIGEEDAWRRSCADRWKDWIKICLLCRKHNIEGCPNFRVSSPVNQGITGQPDPQRIADYLSKARLQSGLSQRAFDRRYAAVSRRVERLFAENKHDLIFKGKWYSLFLVGDLLRKNRGRDLNVKALHAGLTAAASVTMDFSAEWTNHFLVPLTALVADLA